MSASDWIDTTGKTPTLKPVAAVTGFLSTILVGWYYGLLNFIGSAGGGIWGTVDAIRRFLADPAVVFDSRGVHPAGVIPWLFAIGDNFVTTVAAENATWLRSLGIFGIVAGVIEGVVLVYVFAWVLKAIVRRLAGAI